MKVNLAEDVRSISGTYDVMEALYGNSSNPPFLLYMCAYHPLDGLMHTVSLFPLERLTLLYLVSNAVTASLLISLPRQVKLISTSVLTRCTFLTC